MTVLPLSQLSTQDRGLRIRLTASVAVYAAALGSAANLISILARTGRFDDAGHLAFTPGFVTALMGAIAVTLITPLAIYHLRHHANESGSVLLWIILGVGFAVASSFAAGALFPLNVVFITFAEGEIELGEMPLMVAEGGFQGIRSFFMDGAGTIFTWFLAGILFSVGGWTIDKLNASSHPVASQYGPWAFAVSVGLIIVAYAAFGPPETLRTFG
jgi:hypothetical protein